MADDGEDGDGGSPRRRSDPLRRNKLEGDPSDGADFISALPDGILLYIVSLLPTKYGIRTTVLSKRWRQVWSETPELCIDTYGLSNHDIDKTLANHRAMKIRSFHLRFSRTATVFQIHRWFEFPVFRNAEKLSMNFESSSAYEIPDFFYINPSVEQLSLKRLRLDMVLRYTVCWTSLRSLSLYACQIHDGPLSMILSGCPVIESLEVVCCGHISYLNLKDSLHLRRLEIVRDSWDPNPVTIVAPLIRSLRLINNQLDCTLVDVSSVSEAYIDIRFLELENLEADFLQVMLLKMLEKLQHAKKLTFGASFLQILSLAEFRCVPFPTLKTKVLTFETMIMQSVLPGMARLLENSPDLQELTLHVKRCDIIPDGCLVSYLYSQGFNPEECRRWDHIFPDSLETIRLLVRENAKPKLVASFMEHLLRNTRALETMVFYLKGYVGASGFQELLETARTLSPSVSILLKRC